MKNTMKKALGLRREKSEFSGFVRVKGGTTQRVVITQPKKTPHPGEQKKNPGEFAIWGDMGGPSPLRAEGFQTEGNNSAGGAKKKKRAGKTQRTRHIGSFAKANRKKE